MDVHTMLTSWKVVFIILILVSLGVRQSSCCAPITHIEIGKLSVMQSTELLHWLAYDRFYGKIALWNLWQFGNALAQSMGDGEQLSEILGQFQAQFQILRDDPNSRIGELLLFLNHQIQTT